MRWLAGMAVAALMIMHPAQAAAPAGKAKASKASGAKAKASPRKPVSRARKPVVSKPVLPITPGIMVPKAVNLAGTTPAEQSAHLVWSLRAALNVAALQCQYSPFLRTVDNYNQMLRKHGDELASAQTMLINHFTRRPRGGGLAGFDRYNTRSYNSFSTLDAQYNFCWAASQAGLALKLADVGQLERMAPPLVAQIRAALAYVPAAAGLNVPPMAPLVFPPPDPILAD